MYLFVQASFKRSSLLSCSWISRCIFSGRRGGCVLHCLTGETGWGKAGECFTGRARHAFSLACSHFFPLTCDRLLLACFACAVPILHLPTWLVYPWFSPVYLLVCCLLYRKGKGRSVTIAPSILAPSRLLPQIEQDNRIQLENENNYRYKTLSVEQLTFIAIIQKSFNGKALPIWNAILLAEFYQWISIFKWIKASSMHSLWPKILE